jgi:hypothetical protein
MKTIILTITSIVVALFASYTLDLTSFETIIVYFLLLISLYLVEVIRKLEKKNK